MAKEEKVKQVKEIGEILTRCSAAVFTNYRGLSNSQIMGMRKRLRGSEVSYRVVKNTLARIAARETGKEYLEGIFVGPVAMAFNYGEVSETAKVLLEYIKKEKLEISVTAGLAGGRMLSPDEVKELAKLPSKEIMLARVFASMKGPMYGLVNSLSSPMRGFIGVLSARIKQLEGG